MSQNATIFPTLRYHDAAAAIEFLCKAFGFERHAVYEGEGDTIAHAELKFGNGIRGSDNRRRTVTAVLGPQPRRP